MTKAIACERSCGVRFAGGVYAELGVKEDGQGAPLEVFISDPPIKLTERMSQALGVKSLGVTMVERMGTWHILDWVGASHYPNVADFLEEARRFGVSRRLSKTLDFSLLTANSRLLLIHPRGWIDNAPEYFAALAQSPTPYQGALAARVCPAGRADHMNLADPPAMCAQLWWQDIDGGIRPDPRTRKSYRKLPSFSYGALSTPPGVWGKYTPAIVMTMPISRIVVIRDKEGGTHEDAYRNASKAKLPVEFENE